MTDYIERNELIKNLKYFAPEHYSDLINELITKQPAAEVAPVRHGCWVKEKSDVLIHWHCSVCEKCYFLEEPNADYCPRCGAKMDGENL